jgi:pSer/pThr/pTyr-binding forkhead associated (FHA) protein
MHTIVYTGTHHPTIATESRASTEGWLVPIINEKSDKALLAEVRLSQTRVIAVGRKEGIYLCIDHPSVSREHAEIRYANGQYFIRNLSRTSPTSINGVALNSGHASILNPDDMVQFGKDIAFVFEERLVLYDKKALSSSYHQPIVSGQPLMNALPAASLLSSSSQIGNAAGQTVTISVNSASNASYLQENPILVLKAPHETKSIKLAGKKPLMLGRDRKADVQLSDVTISRQHAEIFRGSDGFYIRDLGSSNGVTVNQARIDNPYLLSNGDRIGIGRYVIEFVEGKNHAR